MARLPSKSKPEKIKPIEQLEKELTDFEALVEELETVPAQFTAPDRKTVTYGTVERGTIVRRNFNLPENK